MGSGVVLALALIFFVIRDGLGCSLWLPPEASTGFDVCTNYVKKLAGCLGLSIVRLRVGLDVIQANFVA